MSPARQSLPPREAQLSYAVITPVLDEGDNLQRLIEVLGRQTVPPAAWIIVDTGSTDSTLEIADRIAGEDPSVVVRRLALGSKPTRGGPIVQAFHEGLEAVPPGVEIIVKLDADISMQPDHFERLLHAFERDPALGIAGGVAFERDAQGVWRQRHGTGPGVWGAARAYRRRCLEQLLPLEERIGWDTIDLVGASVRGWNVRLIDDLTFMHHRPEAVRDASRVQHWANQGSAAHYMGYRASYLALRAVYRMLGDPAAIGLIGGFASAAARRDPQCSDEAVRRYVRRQQSLRRLPDRLQEAVRPRTQLRDDGAAGGPRRRVLILVENLSVPFDRRVWQEAVALKASGFDVVVVCPRGTDRDRDPYELREGIEIHRFAPAPATAGVVGYVREYAVAFVRIRALVRRLARMRHFDVVHACNPPDFLLLAAWRLRRRPRYVFDHHDLAPELYLTRFGRRGIAHRALLLLERLSFRLADVVLATNESYKQVALERGRKDPRDVFVVRNAPDPEIFRRREPDPALRGEKRFLIGYVGMMGPQDGVDYALRSLDALRRRRDDWCAVFAGDGDSRPQMERLTHELELEEVVHFTGLVSQEEVLQVLSSVDVCLSPEPSNPLNDHSTMMKVAEYMAMERPVVAFDLPETRRTAADAALYAPSGDVEAFAARIVELLDEPCRRARLGAIGRERIESSLSWSHSTKVLVEAYTSVLSGNPRAGAVGTKAVVTAD